MKIEEGSMVTIKPLRVFRVVGDEIQVETRHGGAWFLFEEVESVAPRPLKVGDKVSNLFQVVGTLIGIDSQGEFGWVHYGDIHKTEPMAALSRFEEEK